MEQVYGRARRLGPLLLPLLLVGGVALDNGGYDPTTWGWSTLLPLVILGAALLRGEARLPGPYGVAFLGLFGAFTAWTFASVAWSEDVAQSVLEGERLLLYAAAGAAFLLVGRKHAERFLVGILAAITLACGWALCLRAFGGPGSYDVVSASLGATRRLAAPLGYSNGLGVFAAIGIVLAVGIAARRRSVAAAAPVLVLVPVLYFTYSRGAWLALGAGLLAAGLLLRPSVPRPVAIGLGSALALALVSVLVWVGGPLGALRKFSGAGPAVKANQSSRLLSLSGSSRAQYWHVAWREYAAEPWLGSGAGSFQRRWLRLRPAALPVLDAHSLYLETLAEVGPIGLLLLVALLSSPLLAAFRSAAPARAAPAFGGYVAFLVHAAQDWDWELPAVTLAGLGCAAVLLLHAERRERAAPSPRRRALALAAVLALALAALGALAGNEALASASAALDRDEPGPASSAARWAERLVPWSPEPLRLHGEAELSLGEVGAAQHDFRRALAVDPADWESWADLALVSQGTARRSALGRARRLNPREQIPSVGG
ncbi:MAG TPA: O-antigen ligase family protein [Gaiellaceae bacterium]